MKKLSRNLVIAIVSAAMLLGAGALSGKHSSTPFKIKIAEWDEWREELFVAGHGQHQCVIKIYNAGNMDYLGEAYCPDKRWSVTIDGEGLAPVPCRVYGEQLEGEYCEYGDWSLDVQNAPDDCGP